MCTEKLKKDTIRSVYGQITRNKRGIHFSHVRQQQKRKFFNAEEFIARRLFNVCWFYYNFFSLRFSLSLSIKIQQNAQFFPRSILSFCRNIFFPRSFKMNSQWCINRGIYVIGSLFIRYSLEVEIDRDQHDQSIKDQANINLEKT